MEMDEFDAVSRFGKSPGGAVGLTVVVEFESGGESGAFEMGAAPEGSPELGRLVSCARDEADALVEDGGGWAAVRVGFGGYRQESCALFRQPHKPAVRCGYPSSRVTSR